MSGVNPRQRKSTYKDNIGIQKMMSQVTKNILTHWLLPMTHFKLKLGTRHVSFLQFYYVNTLLKIFDRPLGLLWDNYENKFRNIENNQ